MLVLLLVTSLIILIGGGIYYQKQSRVNKRKVMANRLDSLKATMHTSILGERIDAIKSWMSRDSTLFLSLLAKLRTLRKAKETEKKGSILEEEPVQVAPVPVVKQPKYLLIKLVADAGNVYGGYELYQTILAAGLQLSVEGAFIKRSDSGEEWFRIIPATAVGSFKRGDWGKFRCQGLVLYMFYPSLIKDYEILMSMFEVGKNLEESLGGKLVDQDGGLLVDIADLQVHFQS